MRGDKSPEQDLFEKFKASVLNVDPVSFIESNLTIDGEKFDVSGGYKPFADIYRYICLKAVDDDSLPVILVKGRQVGATTMAAALEAYFMGCGLYGNSTRSPMRIMHLFPTLSLAAAYTKDKLTPIIQQSAPSDILKSNGLPKSVMEAKMDTSSPANDNMHFKKFLGGNQIWIESTGLTGDRIRGRTVDCLFFDEVQDMTAQAIGAADKIAAQAKYGEIGQGVKVLFGTPKQKGGAYWNMWQKSSQQYFHLHCENCEKHFPLYRPDVNWEDIWLYGFTVKCTHCGHEQDKNKAAAKGKWIPLIVDEPDTPDDKKQVKMHGFHINQLYIPRFSKEKILAQKPGISPTNTERIYMNEVLGEFYDGEGGTISKEEVIDKCLEDRKFAAQITPSDNIRVYAGFDWGQKANLDMMAGNRQGQSYSCAVVLTAHGPELFSVDFATKLTKNDPQGKKDIVEEMFRRYSVNLSVGDVGDAGDLTHTLQSTYGDSFLGSRAANSVNGGIKYRDDVFPKEIVFDRDYYISEMFDLLRRGCIKFPKKSWDKVEWLINHCCSMEVKVTTDTKGEPKRHFVKGNTPNDGFMALLNAYLAWKFDVTQRFHIKQPGDRQHEIAQNSTSGLAPLLGYIPNW